MKTLFVLLAVMVSFNGFGSTPNISQALDLEGRLDPWRFQTGGLVIGAIDTEQIISGSGIFVSAARRATENSPVFLGIETGLIHSKDFASGLDYSFLFPELSQSERAVDSIQSIPVLPTILIRDDSGNFHFYGGVSVGPSFHRVTVTNMKTGERRSTTETHLMAFFRGGADIDISGSVALNLELLRMGLFQEAFSFAPVLSLSASL